MNQSHILFIFLLRHHVFIKCLLYNPLLKDIFVWMRSILSGCAIFHSRNEAFGDVQFFEWNISFHSLVSFFKIECNWVPFKGVSHSFPKMVSLPNIKGNWANFFLVSEVLGVCHTKRGELYICYTASNQENCILLLWNELTLCKFAFYAIRILLDAMLQGDISSCLFQGWIPPWNLSLFEAND